MPLPIPPPTLERDVSSGSTLMIIMHKVNSTRSQQILYPRNNNHTVPPAQRLSSLPEQVSRPDVSAMAVKRDESTDTLLGTNNITSAWAPPSAPITSRRVSILASQGPPDRPQPKSAPTAPAMSQRRATLHSDSFGGLRSRGDLDHVIESPGDKTASQFFETGSKAPKQDPGISGSSAGGKLQVPSMSNGRHSMAFPMLQRNSSSDPPGRLPPNQECQLDDDALFPRARGSRLEPEYGMWAKEEMAGLKPSSERPSGRTVSARGASSYSQYAASIKNPADTLSALDQNNSHSPNTIQKSGSNNSAQKDSISANAAAGGSSFPLVPVSRTTSDASQSTEKGFTQAASAQTTPLQIPPPNVSSSSQQGPMSTPMQNHSSKVPPESARSPNPNSFLPSHTHSQSLPSTSSAYPYVTSGETRVQLRPDNTSDPPLPPSRSSASQSHPGPGPSFPAYQQSATENSKVNYSTSANLSYSAQSQLAPQSQHQSLSTNHHYAMHSNMPLSSLPSSSLSPPDMLSSQNVNQSTSHMYHNPLDPRTDNTSQSQALNHPILPRTPSNQPNAANDVSSKPTGLFKASSNDSPTSGRRFDPSAFEKPDISGHEPSSLSTPPKQLETNKQPTPLLAPPSRVATASYTGRPQSSAGQPARTNSQAQTPTQATKPGPPLQDTESPPGLTPSSSKESLDEVLMTPASLNSGRDQAPASSSTDTLQRPEKSKRGIFGLFRTSSTKGGKGKEKEKEGSDKENLKGVNVKAEIRAYEARVPGPSQPTGRPESIFGSRRGRPASIMDAFAPMHTNSNKPTKATKPAKHAPPPISIPPLEHGVRLVSNKSKHYKAISIASQEALDGTAVSLRT